MNQAMKGGKAALSTVEGEIQTNPSEISKAFECGTMMDETSLHPEKLHRDGVKGHGPGQDARGPRTPGRTLGGKV